MRSQETCVHFILDNYNYTDVINIHTIEINNENKSYLCGKWYFTIFANWYLTVENCFFLKEVKQSIWKYVNLNERIIRKTPESINENEISNIWYSL